MGIFDITTILMVLTAVFSFINYRTLKLSTTIGVMGVSLLVSLGIAGMWAYGVNVPQYHAERISISITPYYMACLPFYSLPGR